VELQTQLAHRGSCGEAGCSCCVRSTQHVKVPKLSALCNGGLLRPCAFGLPILTAISQQGVNIFAGGGRGAAVVFPV
jgi:hypothetical protein